MCFRVICVRAKSIALVLTLALPVILLQGNAAGDAAPDVSATYAECADGVDNDLDGGIDYPQDAQCSSPDDTEGPVERGLFLDVTDGVETVRAGESLSYAIALRSERMDARSVDVQLLLPHQTNLVSVSDGGSRAGEYVLWKDAMVYPQTLRKLFVTVDINPYAREGFLVVAEASADGQRALDTTLVTARTGQGGDRKPMRVVVSDDKTFAEPGEILDYRINVKNITPLDRDFDVQAVIPAFTRFVDATLRPVVERNAVIWKDQELRTGEGREYRLALQVSRDAPELYAIHLRASIPGISSADTTSVHTGVLPSAFTAEVSDGLLETAPAHTVTYEIVVRNNSEKLATDIDVVDQIPDFAEFASATDGGYWTGTNVRWKGLTIGPRGTRTVHVTARVRSDTPYGTTLRNRVTVRGHEAVDQTDVTGQIGQAEGRRPPYAVGDERRPGQESGHIVVRKTADRSDVQPGSTVRFTVLVRNTTDRVLRGLRVQDRMDTQYMRVLGSADGRMSGDAIEWMIPELEAYGEWETSYTVLISPEAPHGVSLSNIVTVSGEGLETVSLAERIFLSRMNVVTRLPASGAPLDALFVGFTAAMSALPSFGRLRKRRLPLR